MTEQRMAPDAAERDARNRALQETKDDIIRGDDVTFVTENLPSEIKAAVLAALLVQREEETNRVRMVESREHEPWARSQRVPEGISDLLQG